ncbi:MAG TPA: hypothetical protein EYP14_15730, partial [Planctomycetaceae bacterium]|nr:hypothetical protein [Planctomycetaceae bacterium]
MRRRLDGQPEFDPLAGRTRLPPAPRPAVTYYVAPNGDDTQPGTRQRPFATLKRARDAIRQRKAQYGGRLPAGGAAVIVRGGVYRVRQTLSLTEADSGTAEAPIVYRAAPGERPVFTGGVVLTGLQPVRDPSVLRRLPETVRDRVRQIDLKRNGVTDLGTIQQRGYGFARYPTHPWVDLYVDDQPLVLARWPNDGFVRVGRVFRGRFRGPDSRQPGEFAYEDERPNRWEPSDDLWMFGYWGHLWAGRGIKVQQIDRRNRRIRTVHGTSYGFREGMPYYYFNVLEELDRPGEWYLDRRRGMAYLIPPEGHEDGRLEFPILEAPFVTLENVSHVTLHGLQFELGRAEGAVIVGGTNDLLAACTFRKLGTHGVVVQGGSRHGVLG